MKKNYIFILLFSIVANYRSFSTILNVPASYTTIQAAINASVNGDTVLVAPGTYSENINFRGKNILLTSQYYLTQNVSIINSTIIDGSNPAFADTASCVIFNHGETSAAILQGFTLTGGKGTKWVDIHGAGTYREGGGILIELCSPTIKHNLLIGNQVTNTSGVSGVGGGGIRIGDGNPTVCSNVIVSNTAGYGPGIVMNYTGGKITNNVIAFNTGGQSFNGGSGIWALNNLSVTPIVIENNTIAYNISSLAGGTGGVLVWGAANVSIHNNIIYGNMPSAAQIKTITTTPTVSYCDVEGGYAGTGNINLNPGFTANYFYLSAGSPCVDAGDPVIAYNDIQDPANLGHALFPSLNLLTNDMGAYGGPCASAPPAFATITHIKENFVLLNDLRVFPNPASSVFTVNFYSDNAQTIKIEAVNILGQTVSALYNERVLQGENSVTLGRSGLESGSYFLKISGSASFSQAIKLVIAD